MTEDLFSSKGELGLSIVVEKLPSDFSHQTHSILQSSGDSAPVVDLTSIPGYAICINAISESQLKHTSYIDQSQPYLKRARELASSMYNEPLVTLKSATTEHVASNPSDYFSVNTFSAIQYVKSPYELLYLDLFRLDNSSADLEHFTPTGIFAVSCPKPTKKKYKKVANRTKPVPTTLPEEFRIIREITGDPLAKIPILSPHPPEFTPTGRYTQEGYDIIEKNHPGDFLWPEERKLMHHFMMEQNEGFAWNESQKGKFREDFFPPVVIPVIEHIPWVHKNIPIPPGLYHEVIDIVKDKIASGIYKPSSSSYRSKWFTVFKKDGQSLRIVHDLQPLNAVTIWNSGVPPFIEQLAETFGGRACYGVFDLFVAFDQRLIAT
ncbi:uncharacterized protein ARMOST_13649 [Armillaria ostoyae]|uniref:Reverse transcriptase domain-containing protein n=1 Tax=Armillaria ostoyae TaxID=47428 RepID=A0A284RNH3_ARMOS|nr:uncharacterized protein ARMOST_13649 [Armillaria ostoyae]